MSSTPIGRQPVTAEQLDACWRCTDEPTGEPFYRVTSATIPDTDYSVRALRKRGRYYLTCNCAAGKRGASCWHKRAASMHAVLFRELASAQPTVVDRRPIRGSTSVVYTVADLTRRYEVVRHGTGMMTCDCRHSGAVDTPCEPGPCRHMEAVAYHLLAMCKFWNSMGAILFEQINTIDSRCDHQHPSCKSSLQSLPMVSQSVTCERDLQLPEAVYQIWSGFPRFWVTGAHSSRQVLTFQGKNCSLFGAFTTSAWKQKR